MVIYRVENLSSLTAPRKERAEPLMPVRGRLEALEMVTKGRERVNPLTATLGDQQISRKPL
jgi:hypothetical protein